MTHFEEQLHTVVTIAKKEIQLSVDEKLFMREKIVAYMDMVPLKKDTEKESSFARMRILSWYSFIASIGFSNGFSNFGTFARARFVPATLVAVLILSMSAGVSYAAESALPGDVLYSVKVGVNEPVVSTFLFSEQARIAWLAQLAQRRLEEASVLAAQGRLDAEKGLEVATRFQAHTTELKERTQQLEASDPASAAEASAEAATTLEANEAILARLAVEKDTPTLQATELVGQVRSVAKEFARISEDAEKKAFAFTSTTSENGGGQDVASTTNTASSSAANIAGLKEDMVIRLRTMAHESLDQDYTLLGRIENQQSESAVRTKAHIEATEAAFTEGQELLAQGEYSQAYRTFKKVAADARTISQLLDAEVMFQIEILPAATDAPLSTDSNTNNSTVGSQNSVTPTPAGSIRESQATNARTRAEKLIADGQQALLTDGTDGGDTLDATRATNFLKEAKAFKLRGDLALVTNDIEEANYLFRQSLEMAQRALTVLQSNEKNSGQETPQTTSLKNTVPMPTPDVASLPMLDVVQVHHSFVNGVHTYEGTFVTPTTCFTLDAETQLTSPEAVSLLLKTTETDANCPTRQLDEKPFSVTLQADERAVMNAVILNGAPSKFVLIEDGNATSATSSLLDVLNK